jgi:probable F420-dependent oxidoreductase
MKIRFAVAPGRAASDAGRFAAFLDAAERLGFDGVWLSDVPLAPLVDPLVGLSYAAASTSRLKLGANIVPLGRNPLSLAKSLAQLDQLSGGRLLLSFVVGLDQPGERRVLGASGRHRGRYLEELLPLVRAWWAGESVDHRGDALAFDGVASPGRPAQDPLEVWFGGRGPEALARCGRVADGWLGAAVTPAEAGGAVAAITAAAVGVGRAIDPEHFGMSVPFAWHDPVPAAVASVRSRRPDVPVEELLPVGADALRDLVSRFADAGVSKFVVRPIDPDGDEGGALERLADVVLALQT